MTGGPAKTAPKHGGRVPPLRPDRGPRGRIGWVVAGSLATGIICALLLAAAPFIPATENGVTQLIDAGGHRLHLHCTGSGSPTVVLQPGGGEMSSNLGWIAPAVAQSTRVCVYDRAGRGWSEPADRRQDGTQIATAAQDHLATLSANSLHRTIDGVEHEGLVATQEGASATTRAILDVVESVRSGVPLAK